MASWQDMGWSFLMLVSQILEESFIDLHLGENFNENALAYLLSPIFFKNWKISLCCFKSSNISWDIEQNVGFTRRYDLETKYNQQIT